MSLVMALNSSCKVTEKRIRGSFLQSGHISKRTKTKGV